MKLNRTEQLIGQLADSIEGYDAAKLVPRQLNEEIIGWIITLEREPDEVQAILGDVVHNMRSSLDHLAVTVVGLNEENTKGVYFPFAESVDELDAQIKRKHFDRASTEALDILKSLKPYRGGNAALRAIHDLDVMDKHRTLIPVFTLGAQQDEIEIGGNRYRCSFELYNGFAAIQQRGTNASELEPVPLKLMAAFGENQPFAFEPLVPTLHSLNELARSIADSFAALYVR